MTTHKYSNGCSKYGAWMGRSDSHAVEREECTERLHLAAVRLDSGGYDNGGAYWGTGTPLWRVACEDAGIEFHLRASTRDLAKATVRMLGYVNARFYR